MINDFGYTLGQIIGVLFTAGILWQLFRLVWIFLAKTRERYTHGSDKLQKPNNPVSSILRQSSQHVPAEAASIVEEKALHPALGDRGGQNSIFISYRREDSSDVTGRIYDRLISEFGKSLVFKDVDALPLGDDFRIRLGEAVAQATVVLAVIGPRWAGNDSISGVKRLFDSRDFVHIELSAALERRIPIIPVLVSGAQMPTELELPGNLANLAYRNAIQVRADPDFHNDMDRLTKGIYHLLSSPRRAE